MRNIIQPIPDYVNRLANLSIDVAYEVHTDLGPGLSEKSYELSLVKEFELRNIMAKRQVYLPVRYKGHKINACYRIDVLVEDALILEIKTVESLQTIHRQQLLSYLKQSGRRLGLLMNFNTLHMKDGIWRVAN